MHVCTCSRCVVKFCFDEDGHKQRGQFVSRVVQLNHHRADLQPAELHTSRHASQQEKEAVDQPTLSPTEDSFNSNYEELQIDCGENLLTVVTIIGIFLSWLHFFCGLSREKCRVARNFILHILEIRKNPILDDTDNRRVPKDIRTTINSLSVSAELERSVCCPVCFSIYPTNDAPWKCTYKKTVKARECGEVLFKMKTLYRGISEKGKTQRDNGASKRARATEIRYPRKIYVTQKLSSWIPWFLGRCTIEEEIETWSNKLNKCTESKLCDIQQSEAWKDVNWPPSSSIDPNTLNLTFSLFIDWFNPRGNKKRGSHQSIGVMAFNCLNLPYSSRNLIQNTCLAGITPGPYTPDMTTISHVLKELVDDLLLLEKGITIETYCHSEGRLVRVKLLPILGDMVAMHKVAGYASHSANLFCSWCWVTANDQDQMVVGPLRSSIEVKAASEKWKAAVTLHKKDVILSETGIRWSEFNRLAYRNAVTHLPLGMMHNWFEGVLHQHFRFRWGFVLFTQEQKSNIKKKRSRNQEVLDQAPNSRTRVSYEGGGGNVLVHNDSDSEINSTNSDLSVQLGTGWDGGLFSKEEIHLFHKYLEDIVLPTGISQLPYNLGAANHGSLKAVQWHSLFSFVIPLIITQLYVHDVDRLQKDSNRGQILLNIGSLCQCTNIVCAKKAGDLEASNFERFYRSYHETSKIIFHNISIRPNHHYALHIPEQIRRWGPLNQVAEFAGERLIGVLQSIETNNQLSRMDDTIMSRFNQWQRLSTDYSIIEKIVHKTQPHRTQPEIKIDPSRSLNWIQLETKEYIPLLKFLRSTNNSIRDYRDMPHPPKSLVFQPYVIPKMALKISTHLSVSVLRPNNCIMYKVDGKTYYGFIRQIYHFMNPKRNWQTQILVNKIINLFPKDLESPSHFFRYILFLLKCVVGQINSDFYFVSPETVVCVAAYRLLPSDVFGIAESGVLLRPYDQESQLQIL